MLSSASTSLLAIALLAGAAFGAVISEQQRLHNALKFKEDLEWEEFKLAYGKTYATEADEKEHEQEFLKRRDEIRAHNADNSSSFKLGFSRYSDLTPSEFQRLNGFKIGMGEMQQLMANHGHKFGQFKQVNESVPAEMDWRQSGNGSMALVTPVKDQAYCGSCWAFSTVGVLEAAHGKATKRMANLSPQNLVDCDVTNAGCQGGFPLMALAFTIDEGGLNTESYYPYQGYTGRCRFSKLRPIGASMVNQVVPLPPNCEKSLMAAVATQGPISVAIEVTYNFLAYGGGVFVDRACGSHIQDLNHAVLVVGYGTDAQHGDYWIVKNSWGSSWGEDGYIRMARNRNNQCGIATQAVYVNIDQQ